MAVINSLNNFRVLQWHKLKDKAHRNKQRLFMAEGYHLVSAADKAGFLKEVITTESDTEFNAPSYQATFEVMEKLSSLATPTKYIGICFQKEADNYKDSILIADQIHHPGNLGTIIRNAAAFNVDTVAVDNGVDVYNAKTIQSTQGTIFNVNIVQRPLKTFIESLKRQEYQIIGTDVKEGISIESAKIGKICKISKKRAVLIGNEAFGLGDELLDMCDIKIKIDMNEKCDSLNVGVAAGIILFYFNYISRHD